MFIIVCNDGSGGGETQGVSMYDKQTGKTIQKEEKQRDARCKNGGLREGGLGSRDQHTRKTGNRSETRRKRNIQNKKKPGI